MRKVMVFGTFDILHPGHINFFNQAKQHGEQLVIVVARDKNVEKFKGDLPKFNEEQRLRYLKQFDTKNKVVLGSLTDPFLAIKNEKPDVICLGYDQESFSEQLMEKYGDEDIEIKRLEPFKEKIYKSSLLKE